MKDLGHAKSDWNRRIHNMNTEALDPSAATVLILASWLAWDFAALETQRRLSNMELSSMPEA